MIAALRRSAGTVLVAFVTAAVVAGGPPLAAMVFDADNAHKVDGRHAVGAGASPAQRAGRLVATNSAGRLPNTIIAKAPDAGRLDGKDGSAYASHGAVTRITQSAGWHALQDDFDQLHQGSSTRFSRKAGSSSTSLTTGLFLTYPLTSFGRAQRLESVEVCRYPQNVTVDSVTVLAYLHGQIGEDDGIFGNSAAVMSDGTDGTANDCVLVTPAAPYVLKRSDTLSVQVRAKGFNGSSQFLFVGRVTATFRAVP